MSQSQHVAIRMAVAALLSAAPALAGIKVHQNRDFDLPTGAAQQIHVNLAGTDGAEEVMEGAPIDWRTELAVTVKARRSGLTGASDVADATWVVLYGLLRSDQSLGGLAMSISPGSANVDTDEADTSLARLDWRFTVEHRTDNNSIT